jgi:DedD protein
MVRQEEQQAVLSEDNSSRNELVLDNWKLVLIFFVGLIICTIFFAAGLIVGRHQPRVAESVPATSIESLRATSTVPPAMAAEDRSSTARSSPPKQTIVDMNPSSPAAANVAEVPSFGTVPAPSSTLASAAENAVPPVTEPSNPEPREAVTNAPETPRASTPSGSVFRVQLAAMKTVAEAQAVVEKLKRKGFEAFVVPPPNSSDAYYRVQMGDFSERTAAQELILKLQQAGERPVLKRQRP